MNNNMVTIGGVQMTKAAANVLASVCHLPVGTHYSEIRRKMNEMQSAMVTRDVAALRDGSKTEQQLIEDVLLMADPALATAWREYVSAIVVAASL